jgi:TolB-like protein/two-component SAPR family response regulator
MTHRRERSVVANVKTAQVRQLRSAEDAAGLRIRLLGPMTVVLDGLPVAIAAKKARALLGYLALREGSEVARGILTELLWGERGEGQARASLRQTLSELKRALGEAASSSILASKEAVAWAQGSAWIDVRLVESAASETDDAALREAAELAGGELMEGLSVGEAGFEQWLAAERERFRLLACGLHARLMERAEHCGRLEEALTHGLKLLSLDPLQEHVHRALMQVYAAQGRHDAALAQYERCRRELSNQLGVQPAPETEGLSRSIRASRRTGSADAHGAPFRGLELEQRQCPALPDRPSIAVLPFSNMSGDPEQEYFADGMVDDIITALSRFRNLFVIARNSTFTYKGRAVDVKQVGAELGVRYVLEGSVRKAGERLRISGQLIDALTGTHLWVERFDGALAEVFELQDQVAASVVGAIAPRLEEAEIERAKRKPTDNLDAYDLYLRGLAVVDRVIKEANDEALQLFANAIKCDPDFALAHARAAQCYTYRKANGWMGDRAAETAEAGELARRAVNLGRNDAVALCYGGFVLGYVVGDLDDGAAYVDRARTLNSNLAAAWGYSGWMKACFGEPDAAIEHTSIAMRLSPLDPRTFAWKHYTALAHFCAGRYDAAAAWEERALRDQPTFASAMRMAAVSHALAGRLAEAQNALARLRRLYPSLRLSNLGDAMPPFRRSDDVARYTEGLRKAGLPE